MGAGPAQPSCMPFFRHIPIRCRCLHSPLPPYRPQTGILLHFHRPSLAVSPGLQSCMTLKASRDGVPGAAAGTACTLLLLMASHAWPLKGADNVQLGPVVHQEGRAWRLAGSVPSGFNPQLPVTTGFHC